MPSESSVERGGPPWSFDLLTGVTRQVVVDHGGRMEVLALSESGDQSLVYSSDLELRVWDLVTGAVTTTLTPLNPDRAHAMTVEHADASRTLAAVDSHGIFVGSEPDTGVVRSFGGGEVFDVLATGWINHRIHVLAGAISGAISCWALDGREDLSNLQEATGTIHGVAVAIIDGDAYAATDAGAEVTLRRFGIDQRHGAVPPPRGGLVQDQSAA